MKKAFTTGIHISPVVVRVLAAVFGVAAVGVLAVQLPDLVRYLKTERM